MSGTPVRYCKDCRFCKADGGNLKWLFWFIPIAGWLILFIERNDDDFKFAKCARPMQPQDYIRQVLGRNTFCSIEREHGCGEEGQYWEPKNGVLRSLSSKQLMCEVVRRGMFKVMQDYKKES